MTERAIDLTDEESNMENDTISRQAAIDAFYEMASDIDHLCTVGDYVHVLEMLPSAQPEQRLSCKNCIHLGHGYMMPCKNCKRNQMLPDWYEVETERKKND